MGESTIVTILANYKTTFFGAVAAAAGYIAQLNGPHHALWASIAGIALAITAALAKDA